MSFPRYPKYKDSGVKWLGEVPEHWDVVQSRRLFRVRNEKPLVSDKQVTASQQYGILYQEEFVAREGRKVVETITGKDTLRRVRPNDFVISLRSFQGGIEWSRIEGSITFHYVVLTPLKHVYEPFFAHLFKSSAYIQALRSTTNLIRDGQDLRFSHFVQVDLPIIPLPEQAAISAFLDRETAKIDALIAEQQRLIELLDEQMKALALSAFTHSVSVERRMETAARLISRPVVHESGEMYTRLGLYNRGRGIFHKEASEPDEMGDSDFFWVEDGDLILSGQFAWEGAVAIAGPEEDGCVVSHRYPVLRGQPDVLRTEFLFALLCTTHGDFLLNENSRGAAGRNRPLNIGSLLKEKIPVPEMALQDAVASVFRNRKALLNEVALQAQLLQERRSALISAAVTGQIDVRGLVESEAA
jgi:type I restriction enzyme S subunit